MGMEDEITDLLTTAFRAAGEAKEALDFARELTEQLAKRPGGQSSSKLSTVGLRQAKVAKALREINKAQMLIAVVANRVGNRGPDEPTH